MFTYMNNNLQSQLAAVNLHTEDKRILSMVENLLEKRSVKHFVEEVERQMAIVFDCERVNLTLVDRFRKVFFRIVYDQYDE